MNHKQLFTSDANVYTYFDITIDDVKIGRIVMELFTDKAPFTAYNFYHLCIGTELPGFDGKLSYKNNFFHRVIRNFMIQAGDIMYGSKDFQKTDDIGKGGCSIYAKEEEFSEKIDIPCYGNFMDENQGEFAEPFYLAMANTGKPNTNNSQFFITTSASPHLKGKHNIFGKVIHGKSVIHTIEETNVDSDGFPEKCIRIADCGVWNKDMDLPLYNACNYEIGGDIFEEYPDDDKHFGEDDFTKALEAATVIKESGTLLFKKKDYQNAFFKYRKSLKYTNEYIPDVSIDKDLNAKFSHLKLKLYLNISLVFFNMQNYDEAIRYATYLLDSDNVPNIDKAKGYYRRANCYFAKKRYEEALKDYKQCNELNPNDKVVIKKIEQIEEILEKRKEKTKKSLAKFFS